MDPVLLSRIQFAVAAGFHFIFPPLTFGLTFIIVIIETMYLRTDRELYRNLNTFLVKILGLTFAIGVATGIVLEFSFGTNWSNYSRMVGDIFGAPLAAEGIFSFFLESVFLGVLLFARDRVSKRFYWLSAVLVFFASHLSGVWILIANSWMQTPAGYIINDGRAELVDFFAAAFNPSTIERILHTTLAGWITGSLFAAGIGAWYLLKERHQDYAKKLVVISLVLFISSSILQFASGHAHSVQVAKTQPEKMAAFEALWDGTRNAPLAVFGIPIESEKKTYLEVAIPGLLSYLVYLDSDAYIQGLNDFDEADIPPVFLPYTTYHIMIGLGSLFALIGLIGIVLIITGKLFQARWYLWILLLSIPLPFISNEMGWISAEVGRQPWAVYKLLRTADAASPTVPAGEILFSLIMFSLIYTLLFVIFVFLLMKIIRKGPGDVKLGYL